MTDETYSFGDTISYEITHNDAAKAPTLAAGDTYPAIVIKKTDTEVLIDVFIPGVVLLVDLAAPVAPDAIGSGTAAADVKSYIDGLTLEEKQALLS